MNFLKKLSTLTIKVALLYVIVVMFFGLVKDKDDNQFTYLYLDTTASVVEIFEHPDVERSGLGSGVFISPRFIMTNNHVVADNGDNVVGVKVQEKSYFGEVVYRNAAMDIAIVKLEVPVGIPVKVGDSSKMIIGDKVYSIGSSLGQENTLGVGYVSGVERYIPLAPFIHIMQISTGIMPGNSGGGVFNSKGELIGISFAGVENFDNMGFVIPINYLKFLIEKYNY